VSQNQFLINFIAAGFQQSLDQLDSKLAQRFDELSTQLTTLLDSRTMQSLEQIEQLKASIQQLKDSDSANSAKFDVLTATVLNEREQVLSLANLAQSQQEALVQKDARIAELLAELAAGTADLQTVSAEISELIANSAQQSAKIDAAITGVREIYNAPVQPPIEEPQPPVEEPQPPVEPPVEPPVDF
jgi:chromosome segregation ATPase